MTRFLLASLLIAISLEAGVVDRHAAVPPSSNVVDSGATRVVASETGMFLAGAQRISSDGILLDAEPIPDAVGHAVAWHDGWLIVNPHAGQFYIRHLRETGTPELVLTEPGIDGFQDAASASGRLAILELDRYDRGELQITILNGREVLRRTKPGFRGVAARIARFGDGFLVALLSRNADYSVVLTALRLSANGDVLRSRVLESGESEWYSEDQTFVTAAGSRALIVTKAERLAHYRIVDEDLLPTPRTSFDQRRGSMSWGVPLAMGDGFLVSYTRNGEDRARVVRPDNSTASDDLAEPIVGGDRSGSRYLVVRPWGHAAVAEGDPRRVVTAAVQLRRRVWEKWNELATVVSGDVTLIQLGLYAWYDSFVRVGADGRAIDPVPRPLPVKNHTFSTEAVAPTPEGFAFTWREGDEVRLRRLTRHDGWLDPQPVTIGAIPGALGYALHANEENLLLAWTTREEIQWLRFAHDGTPLDFVPNRVRHAEPDRFTGRHRPSGISISGNGRVRAIAVQDGDHCPITCEDRLPLMLEVAIIDGGAHLSGPLTLAGSRASRRAIGLADGSWAVPVYTWDGSEPDVLHVSRDGLFLARTPLPELSGSIVDIAPTTSGWKAIISFPTRLYEVEGAAKVRRLTGVTTGNVPRFAAGGRLAYLDDSPAVESVAVPWTSRLATTDGDLSITLTDLGLVGVSRHVSVAVRNEADSDATGAYVPGVLENGRNQLIPLLRSGEIYRFNGLMQQSATYPIHVLSSDVTDTDPSDNWTSLPEAEPRPPRRRPARP
jgi:hypothetical protein